MQKLVRVKQQSISKQIKLPSFLDFRMQFIFLARPEGGVEIVVTTALKTFLLIVLLLFIPEITNLLLGGCSIFLKEKTKTEI